MSKFLSLVSQKFQNMIAMKQQQPRLARTLKPKQLQIQNQRPLMQR